MAKRRGPTWEPSVDDLTQVLREQNPWFRSGSVPDEWAQPVERPLADALWRRLSKNEPRRFQFVLGPRRVGKTTSLYQTVRRLLGTGLPPQRIAWLRLDHPFFMPVPLGALLKPLIKHATVGSPTYVFLDELTYAKDWDLWLKTFYDEDWPVVIAGSSSSTAALRHRRLESGVGRWEEQYLAPYLFGEYLALIGRPIPLEAKDRVAITIEAALDAQLNVANLSDARRRFMLTGGFPELLLEGKDVPADEESVLLRSQRTLRADAVERALYKDIPLAFGVDNPMMLERTLYTLAGQITGLLSPQSICQNLHGLSAVTFERYLAYLERSFLVFTLPNYSGGEASRQKRGRKLYFVDGAVRNASLQRGVAPLNDPVEMGLLLENLAVAHLHALGQQSQVRIYHWRDGDDEVDLIYDDPTLPLAFEIGSSAGHPRSGLLKLISRHPRFRGRCYLVTPDPIASRADESADGIGRLPIDLFLVAISAQAARELNDRLVVDPNL